VYIEDANGIQRATPNIHDGAPTVDVEVLAADGCQLAFPSPSRHWAAFFSPCDDKTLTFYDESTDELSEPDLMIDDPHELVLVADPNATSAPAPELDQLWAFYLSDLPDAPATLIARSPGGDSLTLGTNAALERAVLDKSGDYGFAMVNVNGDTGDYERWDFDGTLTPLAQNVLREGTGQSWADLMIDWDGTAGTLAQVNGGAVYPILERVPRRGYAYQDLHHRQALLSDYDGENGTLSIGELACAPGTTHCERQYYVPHPIAYGVHHPGHAFLDDTVDFLPGIGFLDEYDPLHGTGRFQYRNLELGFTSIVSEGVSDFVFAGNGMLYAVPYGKGAGIWLARAK
jgi:hypothetical protein